MSGGVYLPLGPENGQKDDFLKSIKKNLTETTGEPPEEHRFYPYKAEYRDIVAILRNTSLFSRHRLVILNQAQEIKNRADVDILAEYCKNPVEDATLIMLSDAYQIDRRLADTVPKSNKKIYWELYENQKRSWISGYFQKSGLGIDADAIDLILELVENDTRDLRRECERLAGFLSGTDRISADSVEELIYHSKSESVFTLFEKMVQGDFAGSLEILQSLKLSGEGDPSRVLGGLVWQFRKLMGFRRLIDQRFNTEDAFRKLKIRGKKNQRTYETGARTYSTASLVRLMALFAQYEAAVRSDRSDVHDIYLQKFIFDAVKKTSAQAREETPARA